MATYTRFRSGKNSRVSANGSNLYLANYTVGERVDDLDLTNFESYDTPSAASYDEGTVGVQGLDWSFRGDWDFTTNPMSGAPGIYPRDNLSTLRIYLNVTSNKFWNMPLARVLSANNSSEVRGKVSFDASGKSQHVFTRPAV